MIRGDFIRATSTLAGAIIGVGIFGIPFVFAQAGFVVASSLFAVLAVVVLLQHIMYAEVIERTEGKHRLVGYADRYFGKFAKDIMGISVLVGISGALVAYIAFANTFLNLLFGSLFGMPHLWGVVFWAVMSMGILRGVKTIARSEVPLLVLLIGALFFIIFRSIPAIDIANFSYTNWGNSLMPYGVILFSLVGFQAVPEIRDVLRDQGRKPFLHAVVLGVLLAAFVTFAFGMAVVGVTGMETTPEAIGGLALHLGSYVTVVGALVGFLAVSTSFLILGLNLRETLFYDWNIHGHVSNFITVSIPLFLFAVGVRNFIETIGIIGAVFGALDGTMIALLFLAAKKHGKRKPHFSLPLPRLVVGLIIVSLVAAGSYTVGSIIINKL